MTNVTDEPPVPALKALFRAEILLAQPLEVGPVATGRRRIIPITGGHFAGERLAGEVLPGGADWQLVAVDGMAILDARYTLRTRDGALIYVNNRGVRFGPPDVLAQLARGAHVDPTQYYFRSTPTFETGDEQLAWLNHIVAIGSGVRTANAVIIAFYEVL